MTRLFAYLREHVDLHVHLGRHTDDEDRHVLIRVGPWRFDGGDGWSFECPWFTVMSNDRFDDGEPDPATLDVPEHMHWRFCPSELETLLLDVGENVRNGDTPAEVAADKLRELELLAVEAGVEQ